MRWNLKLKSIALIGAILAMLVPSTAMAQSRPPYLPIPTAPTVVTQVAWYVDNVTNQFLRDHPRWIEVRSTNGVDVWFDRGDAWRRSTRLDPISFWQNEVVAGTITLDDGRVADSCVTTAAPANGTVIGGVVNPWGDEVKNLQPCVFTTSGTGTSTTVQTQIAPDPGSCGSLLIAGPAIVEGIWNRVPVAVKLDKGSELLREGAFADLAMGCFPLIHQTALEQGWTTHWQAFTARTGGMSYGSISDLPELIVSAQVQAQAQTVPATPGQCNANSAAGPAIIEMTYNGLPTVVKVNLGERYEKDPACWALSSQAELDANWARHSGQFLSKWTGGVAYDSLTKLPTAATTTTATTATTQASCQATTNTAYKNGDSVTGPKILEYGEGNTPVVVRLGAGNQWVFQGDGSSWNFSSNDCLNQSWTKHRDAFVAGHPGSQYKEA